LLRHGSGFVLYALMDAVVDRYFPILDDLETELELIEKEIFTPGAARKNIERLYELKGSVMVLKHAVAPLLEGASKLYGGRVPQICAGVQDYFRDVVDHLSRINALIENMRDTIGTAIQVNLAMVTIEESEVTKKLAAWASIFAVCTAFAGIWGMNFEAMPELKWRYGYVMAISLIIVACSLLYWRFRRAKLALDVTGRRGGLKPGVRPAPCLAAGAAFNVIVDQTHGLHEGIHRGRAHKTPAAFFQVFGQAMEAGEVGMAFTASCVMRAGRILASGSSRQTKAAQRTKFFSQLDHALCVVDGRGDLSRMPHDAGIVDQPLDVARVKAGHLLGFKVGKGAAKGLAFVQNSQPAQPCLKAFEADFLEQPAFVVHRETPFVVVVVAIEGRCLAPGAARGVGVVGEKAGGRCCCNFWGLGWGGGRHGQF
jgi:hypothetical protein